MAASAGPIPWKLGGIRHCLAVRARDRRCLWKAGKMAGSVWGWEPALETGPQEGKGREHGWAEVHKAQPGSVGRCWMCRGSVGPWCCRIWCQHSPGLAPGMHSWPFQSALQSTEQGELRDCWDVKGHYRPPLPQFGFSWRLRSEAAHWRVSLSGSGAAL